MKRRHAIASLAGAAAWLAGCSDAHPPQAQLRWPALAVRDLAGRPATLPAASGGARLINIWALWCPPCRHELPSLRRLALALAPRGIEVSAVALADDTFAVREYLAEHAAGLHGVVLSPGLPEARELNLGALPQTFLVAADAAVLARWTGARDWDAPSVRNQLDRLLQAA